MILIKKVRHPCSMSFGLAEPKDTFEGLFFEFQLWPDIEGQIFLNLVGDFEIRFEGFNFRDALKSGLIKRVSHHVQGFTKSMHL